MTDKIMVYWTALQLLAIKAMDKFVDSLRQSSPNWSFNAELWELRQPIANLVGKITTDAEKALRAQDAYIANIIEREQQRQTLETDFPTDRAERLMFGKVNSDNSELCMLRQYELEEPSEPIIVEFGKKTAQSERYARQLERQNRPEAAQWVREHSDIWDVPEHELRPIVRAVNGYIRIIKDRIEFVPGYLRVIGYQEVEDAGSGTVVQKKPNGTRITDWAKFSNRTKDNLGLQILRGMVRMRHVKPADFLRLLDSALAFEGRFNTPKMKAKMWDFYHKVWRKRDLQGYNKWTESRRSAKPSQPQQ